MKVSVSCGHCGSVFMAHDREIERGRGRFCSRACVAKATHSGLPKPKSRENLKRAVEATRGRPAHNAKPRVTVACETCRTPMALQPSRVGRTRFCSAACKHAQRRMVTGPEHWLFTREQRACQMCGLIVWVKKAKLAEFRFCSRRCHGSFTSNLWPRTSSLEIALQNELTARGITFHAEHAIGPYSVDLAFPEALVAIEADGAYWHGSDRQQAKDRRKDGYLRSIGWTVVRFTEAAIIASPAACIDEVMPLLASQPNQPRVKIHADNLGARSGQAGC